MTDFGPDGLGISKWIPGAASTLAKAPNPTGVLWATSAAPKPSLEGGPVPPELCPREQVPVGYPFESRGGEDSRVLYVALESELLLPNLLCTMICFWSCFLA